MNPGRRRLALGALFLLVSPSVGCAEPQELTELVLTVRSALQPPTEIDRVVIEIANAEEIVTRVAQPLDELESPRFPLTLGVAPSGGFLGPISIEAIGYLRTDPVASARLEVTLERGRSITRELLLSAAASVDCAPLCPEVTCGQAHCTLTNPVDGRELRINPRVQPAVVPDPDAGTCDPGTPDFDGDGFEGIACGGMDCNDRQQTVHPGQDDLCDGVDSDCDSTVDEECVCFDGERRPCTTDCGSVGVQTCADNTWLGCALVAESCNGADDDCDGLTDEGFTYGALQNAPISPPNADGAEIYWVGDRFVVGWASLSTASASMTTFASDGTTRTAPTEVSARDVDGFHVAAEGTALGVAYWDRIPNRTSGCPRFGPCNSVRFQVLDRDTLMPRGDVTGLITYGDYVPRPRVAWTGGDFAVTYSVSTMRIARFTAGGSRIGTTAVLTDPARWADMAWTGSRFLFAFSSADTSSNLYFRSVLEGDELPPTGAIVTGPVLRPSLAPHPLGYLVAYYDGNTHLDALIADASGAIVVPPVRLTTIATQDTYPFHHEVGIAVGAHQSVITWVDQNAAGSRRVGFARLGPRGELVQPGAYASVDGGEAERPRVATDGDAFWLTFTQRVPGPIVHRARLGCVSP